MYIFGFPEGLAGGSKETEYLSYWQTSHETTYNTMRNTTYTGSRNTSRGTVKTSTTYPELYPRNYDLAWYDAETINTGTLPIETAYGWYIGPSWFDVKYRLTNGGWGNGAGGTLPANNGYTSLHPDNVDYVTSVTNGWSVALMGYHSPGKYYVRIVTKSPNATIADGTQPNTTSYSGTTSWNTTWPYTVSTYWGTAGFTQYQTNQTTNHITYG